MLQIEGWFRRPQKRPEKRTVSASRQAAVTHRQGEVHTKRVQPEPDEPMKKPEYLDEPMKEPEYLDEPEYFDESEDLFGPEQSTPQQADDLTVPEDEPVQEAEPEAVLPDAIAQENTFVADEPQEQETEPAVLRDPVAETDELEHISQKIGMDVSDMIDLEKEDILIQQIDEFREKAKQLQQLMQNRESKAKELQGVVEERTAKARSLDQMMHARRGEADKIMKQVSQQIDAMSVGVRTEMNGLSDTVSKEVGGLTQNLAHEISQSTEKTRQAVEAATQNMIDQNTRSLEGLKEQLDQLNHSEQIGELSTEMNSQMTTLREDLVEKIHAEDVKCYRNIQVSLDEQSKLLSEGDEQLRGHVELKMDELRAQMNHHASLIKASLTISILNLLGIAGLIALLILR